MTDIYKSFDDPEMEIVMLDYSDDVIAASAGTDQVTPSTDPTDSTNPIQQIIDDWQKKWNDWINCPFDSNLCMLDIF